MSVICFYKGASWDALRVPPLSPCLAGCWALGSVVLDGRLSGANKTNDYPPRAKQQDPLLHSPVMSWQSNKKGDYPSFLSYISLMLSFYSHFAKQINQQIACFNELKLNSGC